ncbi:tRNA 4-thiouridine(8) synthase ThiI [Mycoplasmatota bacterium]|nr:tRNA 4-thiouridine(8) synthase ThiI [Mycoplasmatota bacterium]
MLYDRILIKYGELTLKGKNKYSFIKHTNYIIKEKCKNFPNLKYISNYERFYIILNGENHNDVINALNKVFGLHAYCLTAKCESDLESIKDLALKVIKEEIKETTTFKVETKRADKLFPMTSLEVSKTIASHVLKESSYLVVDVKNPQVTLRIEIRDDGTYISTKEIPGLGGLPVGKDGKGLLMLSGGIDSPIAGYLIQKRGVAIDAVHFSSPPYTSLRSKQKVLDLTEKLAHYDNNSKIKVYDVPFTKLQKAIYENCPHSYAITIMRRMMYRIAEKIALKNQALIIVNGENVGQVASQTMQSMYAINQVSSMPIIRPCATMDKLEIISIARKIDTYDISIRPYEDCCTIFVPKNPVTKPELDKCIEFENKFNYEQLISECIDNIKVITVKAGEPIQLVSSDELNELF